MALTGLFFLLFIVFLVLAVATKLFTGMIFFKKLKEQGYGPKRWSLLALGCLIAVLVVTPDTRNKSSKQLEPVVSQPMILTEEQKAAQIKKNNSKITEVQVVVTANGEKVWSIFVKETIFSNVIYETGMLLSDISKKLIKEKLVEPKDEFLFFVNVPTTDQYGRSGEGLAMKIAWQGEDLLKIDWKNMFPPMFLNLASRVELRPIVRADVAKLAQDPKEAAEYRGFLVKALAK